MSAELLDAAREYSIASDRYHAACLRIAIAHDRLNVMAAEWDADTLAACKAANDAQGKLLALAEKLFPQTVRAAVWEEYYAKFYDPKAVAP